MSVTVVATPFLLLPAFISAAQAFAISAGAAGVATAGITGVATSAINSSANNSVKVEQTYKEMNEEIKKLLSQSNGLVSKEIVELVCREYKTAFVDENLLIKTLKEHGAENIYTEYGNIACEMEGFLLEFYKQEPAEEMAYPPYIMKITTKCNENELQNFVSDINSEYTRNTQEENYIKIKERLDKQNMRIAEEEVFDDDTIVLTINID